MMKGIDLKVYGTAPSGALLVSADEVNSGIQSLIDENANLKQRNAELEAKVHRLLYFAQGIAEGKSADASLYGVMAFSWFNQAEYLIKTIPAQCLAEHDREVTARAVDECVSIAHSKFSCTGITSALSEYANKIKSGKVEI